MRRREVPTLPALPVFFFWFASHGACFLFVRVLVRLECFIQGGNPNPGGPVCRPFCFFPVLRVLDCSCTTHTATISLLERDGVREGLERPS